MFRKASTDQNLEHFLQIKELYWYNYQQSGCIINALYNEFETTMSGYVVQNFKAGQWILM